MAQCANYQDQEAIDAVLRRANEGMLAQDKMAAWRNPSPFYRLGTNSCHECYYGVGEELNPTVRLLNKVVDSDHKVQRVCYKEGGN